MTTIHVLKCWPHYYYAIESGKKTWEVRRNDRDYHVGDTLCLRPWSPITKNYLAGELRVRVTYIADISFIMPGYVGMSIDLMERGEP